ncbi:MAG TPA: DUF1707 domain-containing protein [Solirubrobacteraceae bacterium]|nr:DUF1707 domain-containing protein [Solirubrobacteraceae bacterium]
MDASDTSPEPIPNTAGEEDARNLPAESAGDRHPILASDAEREQTVARLREAVGEGRLTLEEFSERVGAVQLARTDQELAAVSRDLPATRPSTELLAEPETHRAVCSHLIRQGPWSLPVRSRWSSWFGTIDLDLREARLSASDTEIAVQNVFGTVTLIVPDGLEVVVRGGGLFASQKIESPQRPPAPGAPRLIIDASGPGGTLHVRSRPPRQTSLRALLRGE